MVAGAHAPARLGRYELLARLATGGMGEIFLARLEGAAGFEKLYVIKRILPHLADDARFRQMLIGEARIASRLSHGNICQVYELGETDGQLYIVMEYLEGVTMLPLLRKASKEAHLLELGFVGGVLQQVAEALHYAHELKDRNGQLLGLVHRDVTPSNIFITDSGVAKVLDFGIAKVKDASTQTQTGTVKGKYAYMAPEQLRGASVDRRADVFALGIVIFEMLALRRLFQRKTDYLTFRAVMEQPIPDVRTYRPDAPDALAEALMRALDRDPANRFESARALATAVLDGIAPARPWSQGEISDYMRMYFAPELSSRTEQIAGALHRTKPGGVGRSTMPLLEMPDQPHEGDDEDDFPAVETVQDTPVLPEPMPPPGGDFHGPTPVPFGVDSNPSGHQLQPLPYVAPAAAPRRSLFWPLLATVMVAITGFALFLVWRQLQQPQQPPVVNITSEPANPAATVADAPAAVEDPAAPGSGSAVAAAGSGSAKRPAPTSTRPRRSPYDEAIQSRRAQITQCAQQHGTPPANARVVIVVTTAGKARTITLEPADLDGSPLGVCIKNVLTGAKYPAAAAEMQVSVALRAS